MTEYTEFTINSYSVNVTSAQVGYRIDTTCISPGELPTIHVFAFSIGDVEDVTTDKFDHVATIHEIQNVIVDRDAAIAADSDFYYLSAVELDYEDLEVAIQARAQFKSRLNDLTKGWIQYRDDFGTGEITQLFPSSDPELEDETVEAYVDARTTREEAEVAVTVAEAAVVSAQDDIDNAQEFINQYTLEDEFLDTYLLQLDEYFGLVITEGSQASTYRTLTLYPTLANRQTEVRAKLAEWTNTKAARQAVYETALQTKIAASQELAAAQAAEDEALAAALAANPDFDPNSV